MGAMTAPGDDPAQGGTAFGHATGNGGAEERGPGTGRLVPGPRVVDGQGNLGAKAAAEGPRISVQQQSGDGAWADSHAGSGPGTWGNSADARAAATSVSRRRASALATARPSGVRR